MENPTPVSLALTELGIPHRQFTHPGPVKSLEQAAEERGQQPEQVIRSILFRVSEDNYLMVLVAGPAQISWPALRKYLGESRISMAKPETVLEITGYPVGAVAPFGNPHPVRVLVDESVLIQDEISIGSGVRGTTIFITKDSLVQALGTVEKVSLLDA